MKWPLLTALCHQSRATSCRRAVALITVPVVACVVGVTARAQPAPIAGDSWPTDRIVLDDGRSFAGLLESEQNGIVDFVEVRRPAGKPMFLIVHPIEKERITELKRLDEASREVLRKRLLAYRNRARIEAGRADAVRLHSRHIEGLPWWENNAGKWFQLRTTLDESRARRVVVRLEQIFHAYRQVLPAMRPRSSRPLSIIVHGRRNEYIEALRSEDIEFGNPALFEPAKNRVIAGCTLNELVDRVQAARQKHDQIERQLRDWDREFIRQVNQRDGQLQEQGMASAERSKIAAAMRRRWNRRLQETQQSIGRAERQNQKLVADETDALVRLLFHEALHAYLENAVYDREASDIPGWLNEGLAQIFEAARIEADLMRIDAPDPARLAMLQRELRREDRLTLSELLNANHDVFLAEHGSDKAESDKHYLWAWGLVYHLAFDRQLIGSRSMQAIVARSGESGSPVKRFEEFVGMPLAEFEPRWIEAMLAMGEKGVVE